MKRLLSLILCAVFLFSFAACSKEKSADNSTPDISAKAVGNVWDSHYDGMSEASLSAFENLCNAVKTGEDSVSVSADTLDDVNTLYYTSFPLSALVESLELSSDGAAIDIYYKNDKKTHLELVSNFENKVNEIASACGLGSVGSDRYVFNVYHYICENVAVDDTVLSPYDTIISLKGSAQSVSQAFEYLLLIGGVKASHIVNFDNGINVMSVSQLGGNDYIFCPYCEIKNTDGKGLTYFAMGSERAENAFMLTGFKYTDETPLKEIAAGDYGKLADCKSYTFDDEEIKADCGGTEFIMPFK